MRRLLIIISVVSFLFPFASRAQDLSNSERRHLNHKILMLVKDYERYSTIYDEEAEYYFTSLFENENSSVFCDMIGQPQYMKSIPLNEYVELLKSSSANTNNIIMNVRKEQMTLSDNLWQIPVHLDKTVSYIDKFGYVFSGYQYHKADYDIVLNLIYDKEKDICQIRSVSGSVDSDIKFPEGRFVIVQDIKDELKNKNYNRYFQMLRIAGKGVTYNEFGQCVLPSAEPVVDFSDIIVKCDTLLNTQNYDVISVNGFKSRIVSMGIYYGFSPNAYKPLKNNVFRSSGKNSPYSFSSPVHEFGLDLLFSWPISRMWKVGLRVMPSYSSSKVKLGYEGAAEGNEYDYKFSIIDKNSGLTTFSSQRYKIEGARQELAYNDVVLPVYLHVECLPQKLKWKNLAMSFFGDIGIRNYMALGVKAKTPYTVNFTSGSEHIQNWIPERFVEPNVYVKNMFKKVSRLTYEVSGAFNIGVDLLMYNHWSVSLMYGYEIGLMPSYVSSTSQYIDVSNGIYPIIYNNANGEHIAVHSLVSGLAFRRNSNRISISAKYKF